MRDKTAMEVYMEAFLQKLLASCVTSNLDFIVNFSFERCVSLG
jgi:hypothetical protein